MKLPTAFFLFLLWATSKMGVTFSFKGASKRMQGFEAQVISGQTGRRKLLRTSFLATCAAFLPNVQRAQGAEQEKGPLLYQTVADIPVSILENHQILYGYVERVIDGDTIRIRHIPHYMLQQISGTDVSSIVTWEGPIGNNTIVVRMYGIDAPETAKRKSEVSQPFGEEAKEFTEGLIFHKVVAIKPLRKDKYQRLVGEVETYSSGSVISSTAASVPIDLSLELVSRGLATLYTGGGAEYDVSLVPRRWKQSWPSTGSLYHGSLIRSPLFLWDYPRASGIF